MPKYNVLSKQCPICQQFTVAKVPSHFCCGNCSSGLKTKFSLHVLLAIPVFVGFILLIFFAGNWIKEAQFVSAEIFQVLLYGVGGFAFSVTMTVFLHGLIFVPILSRSDEPQALSDFSQNQK